MREQLIAQIPRDVFLQRCAKLTAEPDEDVLHADDDGDDDHHRAERA